jgi:hypothetical protein
LITSRQQSNEKSRGKRPGKQASFQKDTNHIISKSLVEKAKAPSRAIVLEDLSGISKKVRKDEKRLRQTQRAKHSNRAGGPMGFLPTP